MIKFSFLNVLLCSESVQVAESSKYLLLEEIAQVKQIFCERDATRTKGHQIPVDWYYKNISKPNHDYRQLL